MKIINGIEHYSSTEAINYLGLKPSSFYDLIKQGKIIRIKLHNGDRLININILKEIKEQNLKKHKNIEIKEDEIKNDVWLLDSKNLSKIKEWNEGRYINWSNMNLEDYTKYWRYIIKPFWIQSEEYKNNQSIKKEIKPPNRWIIKNVSKGFVESFNKKYLYNEGIQKINEFFDYLIKKNLW